MFFTKYITYCTLFRATTNATKLVSAGTAMSSKQLAGPDDSGEDALLEESREQREKYVSKKKEK